jgi:hypothetical protein
VRRVAVGVAGQALGALVGIAVGGAGRARRASAGGGGWAHRAGRAAEWEMDRCDDELIGY